MDAIQLKKNIIEFIDDKTETGRFNYINPGQAISEEYIGMKIFDEPLVAIGAAHDPVFEDLKKENAIGPWAMSPEEWLSSARSVISIFFPFTEKIRNSNREKSKMPSDEWLHGRVEGHDFMFDLASDVRRYLELNGFDALVPSLDPRFHSQKPHRTTSNWSERHVAFICGLGTFGVSKNLITEKGCAGRLISIVTSLSLPVTVRPYKKLYEYCLKCGACARLCPVHAFGEHGKDVDVCAGYVDYTKARCFPRYGCGKCMVGVPCERRNPTGVKNGGR